MKQSIHSCFLFVLIMYFASLQADGLLVVVLMVKNEALAMQQTLQPLVDGGVQQFLIYDTGSTDQTIEVTQDFLKKNNITNFVIQKGDWVDFSTCRNQAIALTKQYFTDTVFMLMLDADWILHGTAELLEFCKKELSANIDLYTLQVKDGAVEFAHPRLMRIKSDIAFVGKVHERLNVYPTYRVPSEIYFELFRTKHNYEKSKERWLFDQKILLQEIENNSADIHTLYDLAQTFFWLGDINNAIKWYQFYFSLSEIGSERYYFLMGLAKSYGVIGDAVEMVNFYLKAFECAPHRAEPLIKIAQYYYSIGAYQSCFLFAKQALSIPYPENDFGLIESELYNFVRYDLISATAFIANDFKLGYQATLKALEKHADLQYLHQNLAYYEQKLKKD